GFGGGAIGFGAQPIGQFGQQNQLGSAFSQSSPTQTNQFGQQLGMSNQFGQQAGLSGQFGQATQQHQPVGGFATQQPQSQFGQQAGFATQQTQPQSQFGQQAGFATQQQTPPQ